MHKTQPRDKKGMVYNALLKHARDQPLIPFILEINITVHCILAKITVALSLLYYHFANLGMLRVKNEMFMSADNTPNIYVLCLLIHLYFLTPNIALFFRLAISFTTVIPNRNVQPLKLDWFYQQCQKYFNGKNIFPPSKNTVGKLIISMFQVDKCLVFEQSLSYSAYAGLIPRCELSDRGRIVVPEHCQASLNSDGELEIVCGREFLVNHKQISCSITFGKVCTQLIVRGITTPLNVHINPTQKSVDGLAFLLTNIPVCKGVPSTNLPDVYNREVWSEITCESQSEERVRVRSCKNVLSFCSKVGYCEPCGNTMRRLLNKNNGNQSETDFLQEISLNVNMNGVSPMRETSQEKEETIGREDVLKVSADMKGQKQEEVDQAIDRLLQNGAPHHFKTLLMAQIKNSNETLDYRHRRWDPKVISLCLSLYVRSPAALEDLRSSGMLILPSVRLLQLYKNCIKQRPGLTEENLSWMLKEADRQEVSTHGRRGGLIMDELTIQDDLKINRSGDAWSLTGACDMGPMNNDITIITNGSVKTELASHCLQFMFHGLCSFRWPVAYYGSNPAKAHQLYVSLWDCVDALDENGFVVDYIMFDGASTNRSLTNILTNDKPR